MKSSFYKYRACINNLGFSAKAETISVSFNFFVDSDAVGTFSNIAEGNAVIPHGNAAAINFNFQVHVIVDSGYTQATAIVSQQRKRKQ